MKSGLRAALLVAFTVLSLTPSFASYRITSPEQVPPCLSQGQQLAVNNEEVLNWKRTTRNQYHDRGRVRGVVGRSFQDRTGHLHFELVIGPHRGDNIEIVYNQKFGSVPPLRPGMRVEACGDYITAREPSGGYPASPAGALVHWVHENPDDRGHPHGYMIFYSGAGSAEGELCGFDGDRDKLKRKMRH